MSKDVLLPSTLAILKKVPLNVNAIKPLFSNQIQAALFEQQHSLGSLTVHPRSDVGYIVFDTKAANGEGVVEDKIPTEEAAHKALERHAAARKK